MAVDLDLKKAQDLNRKFFLVAGGQPRSVFYIQPNAHPILQAAAKEMAGIIYRASGAQIPVVEANFDEVRTKNAVFLTEVEKYPPLKGWFPYETEFVRGEGDGFAVRTQEGNCYIFGETPQAVFFGAMDMMEQTTDAIWYQGEFGEGEILQKQKNVYAFCNYYNKSYFNFRAWHSANDERIKGEACVLAKNKINAVLDDLEGKNGYSLVGEKPFDRLKDEGKRCRQVCVYEEKDGYLFPNVYALRDTLREYYRQGVKEVCLADGDLRCERNEMYYWIAAKLMWNFDNHLPTLRRNFCEALYGNASKEMLLYYDLLERSWREENATSLAESASKALEAALKKELTPTQRRKIQAACSVVLTK